MGLRNIAGETACATNAESVACGSNTALSKAYLLRVLKHYSYFNDTIGSTRAARRAGRYAANNPEPTITTVASAITEGSVADSP